MTLLDFMPLIGMCGILALVGGCLASMLAICMIALDVHRVFWSKALLTALLVGLSGFAATRLAHDALASI